MPFNRSEPQQIITFWLTLSLNSLNYGENSMKTAVSFRDMLVTRFWLSYSNLS